MGLRHLVIELSPNSVQFTSISPEATNHIGSFEFRDKIDYRYKEQLDEFIASSGLKAIDHDEHTISWSSLRTTLIPSNVFGESDSESIFRVCFGASVPVSDIDYNRIPEAGIVNVYEIPMWVKSYFVVRHPRSIIQHESTMLIRSGFSQSSFRLKTVLVPYADHFVLMISNLNKLQFYSVFDYQNAEDILYHLMFTLQQKEFLQEEGELIYSRGNGASEALFEKFSELKSKIKDLEKLKLIQDPNLILNSHKLCV